MVSPMYRGDQACFDSHVVEADIRLKGRRFVSCCVHCSWKSKPYNGPATAGFAALWHVKIHPEVDGLAAVILEVWK